MRFVLVHGGFHGAWCWSRTIPELERLGHEAVAIDVPGHGARVHETATLAGRLEAVTSVLRAGDVLVGHSGGGLEITRAADAAPELVSHLVYLAAALPLEGRLMQEALVYRDDGVTELDFDVTGMLQHLRIGSDASMAFADAEGARALFYHDCDDATVRWAFEHLTPETAGDTADDTDISAAILGGRPLPKLRRLRGRPRATEVARGCHRAAPRCRTAHDPRVTLSISEPSGRVARLLVEATATVPVGPLKPNG